MFHKPSIAKWASELAKQTYDLAHPAQPQEFEGKRYPKSPPPEIIRVVKNAVKEAFVKLPGSSTFTAIHTFFIIVLTVDCARLCRMERQIDGAADRMAQ